MQINNESSYYFKIVNKVVSKPVTTDIRESKYWYSCPHKTKTVS